MDVMPVNNSVWVIQNNNSCQFSTLESVLEGLSFSDYVKVNGFHALAVTYVRKNPKRFKHELDLLHPRRFIVRLILLANVFSVQSK